MKWWRTRDGRHCRLVCMEKAHLKNCAAMLKRQGFVTQAEFERLALLAAMKRGMPDGRLTHIEHELARRRFPGTD